MDPMDERKDRHLRNLFKSTEVEKRFLDAIKENIDYIKASEAVDLGAGGGRFALVLSEYVKTLYCVDVSDDAIKFMRLNLAGLGNTKIIKVQAERLPFADRSMDLVFSANSFHDLPVGYEAEISRVLNENGRFIDLDWKKERTEGGPPVQIRLSGMEVIVRLKAQGFALEKEQDIGTHYMLVFLRE